jgi:hypothetical protein
VLLRAHVYVPAFLWLIYVVRGTAVAFNYILVGGSVTLTKVAACAMETGGRTSDGGDSDISIAVLTTTPQPHTRTC